MKKYTKIILLFLMATCILLTSGCQVKSKPTDNKKVTAQSILDKLKTKQSSYMTDITVITSENDSNKLLGRPNQYIEKISWKDNRADSSKTDCSIELFANKADAETRKAYIENAIKSLPILVQYMTIKDNALLRIQGSLTPEQAKEYENLFK